MVDPVKRTLQELRARGAPSFFERDPIALRASFKAQFEAVSGRTLYPAQPEMYLIEVAAYALSILHEAAQTATEQNTAVFAEGIHLENRGANVSTMRLLAQPAKTTLRFSLSVIRLVDVVVPVGTRVSAGPTAIFATDASLIIPAGMLSATVTATAMTPGAAWNGLAPGTVKDILDPIAYVSDAANTVPVAGGTDVEEQERYRNRVVNALFTIAKTGPRNGYREHVMAVDPEIVDVAVIRPEPGYIRIYPLMRTGLPSEQLKAAILAYLDPETLRPQGDDVSVLSPVAIDLAYTLTVRTAQIIPGMQAAALAAAIAAHSPWTQELGAQIAPSVITSAVKALPGVTDVAIAGLAFTDLADHQFPNFAAPVINVVVTANV